MKPEIKKLLILNLPYLLFVWLFDKVGAAVRLSPRRGRKRKAASSLLCRLCWSRHAVIAALRITTLQKP